MTFQIIIRGKEQNRAKLRGKTVSEFAKNLESEGWPSEFLGEKEKDVVKYAERRKERRLRPQDCPEIAKEIGLRPKGYYIKEKAMKLGCEYWPKGQPEPDK